MDLLPKAEDDIPPTPPVRNQMKHKRSKGPEGPVKGPILRGSRVQCWSCTSLALAAPYALPKSEVEPRFCISWILPTNLGYETSQESRAQQDPRNAEKSPAKEPHKDHGPKWPFAPLAA